MKNRRLGTKLAFAILPVGLVALLAGGLLVRNALDLADQEERASVAADVAASAMDAFERFLEEHEAALDTALGSPEGSTESQGAATDDAVNQLTDSVTELIPLAAGPAADIVTGLFTDSNRALSLVATIRGQDPTSPEAIETVDGIGLRLISVVTGAGFYLGDESRVREGEGAVALARAALASFQQEMLIRLDEAGLPEAGDDTLAQELQVLEWTVEDWVNTASDSSPTVRALGYTRTLLPGSDQTFTSDRFDVNRHEEFVGTAAEMLRAVSESAAAESAAATERAATVAAIVVGALLLAAATAFAIGRSTTRRVRSVTAAAHRVAEVDLPKMVDSLSNPSGELEATTVVDVDETGNDEIGDLARSFSTLHSTLVQVANQQMETLRKGVSEIFVTLARRNRSLVDRQLALVDQLESKEEDPEILDGYYKLDHLATRMRRNAESLLVLADVESPRMWNEPLEMGDVIRAAIGEVDEYQRIDVLAVEPSRLGGQVITDVSHLLAELLDNATHYSPPTERVRVTGLFDDDGYVVIIADSGVGISAERRAELNELIENPPVVGLALQPTLGMYVVARLSERHGIKVKLVEGVPGTTVRVTIPRNLFAAREDLELSEPGGRAAEDTADQPAVVSSDNRPGQDHEVGREPEVAAAAHSPLATDMADSLDGTAAQSGNGAGSSKPDISTFRPSEDRAPNGKSEPARESTEPVATEPATAERDSEELNASKTPAQGEEEPDKVEDGGTPPESNDRGGTPKTETPFSTTERASGSLAPRPRESAASPGAPRHLKPAANPTVAKPVQSEGPETTGVTPSKRTEFSPAEAKTTENEPVSKPAQSGPTTPQSAEAQPAESEPTTPKPAESKPAEINRITSQLNAPRPPEPRPEEPQPAEPGPSQPGPGRTEPSATRPPVESRATLPDDQPQDNGSLPKRDPGTSYRDSNETVASSAISRSGAMGIRNALDGYRQGRDIASKEGKRDDEGQHTNDDEEAK